MTKSGTIGRTAIVKTDIPFSLFVSVALLKLVEVDVDVRWIEYSFQNWLQNTNVQNDVKGTAIKNLHLEDFRQMWVPFPPLPEQHRIVAAIETYFSRLDKAVEALERVKANLKRYRASVLKAAVEGRLVPTEAELAKAEGRSFEPASVLLERILKERRKKWEEAGRKGKYKTPAAPDTNGLPELPEGWCWATVEQLAADEPRSLTDGPFGSNLKTAHYTDSGPRVVRLQNIGETKFQDAEAHVSESHYQKLIKHAVFEGDIVIASLGEELPRACLVPKWLGDAIVKADCLRYKPNPNLAFSPYIMFTLNSRVIRNFTKELIHGVGRPRIGLTVLREIPIPLPPFHEQIRIAEEIHRLWSVSEKSNEVIDTNLQRTTRLRQAILKWAFEGKLADQDPNDEPASELLERIRQEREGMGTGKKVKRRGRKG